MNSRIVQLVEVQGYNPWFGHFIALHEDGSFSKLQPGTNDVTGRPEFQIEPVSVVPA